MAQVLGKSMDNGSQYTMTLERMPQGGYVVIAGRRGEGYGCMPEFASSTIDDALKFLRDKMSPIEPEQGQAG